MSFGNPLTKNTGKEKPFAYLIYPKSEKYFKSIQNFLNIFVFKYISVCLTSCLIASYALKMGVTCVFIVYFRS